MYLSGYRDLEFLAPGVNGEGYSAGLPANFAGMPEIAVNVLARPGTTPTFAPLEVHEMTVRAEIFYMGTALTYQQAYSQLFRRLDVFNRVPGQLRATMNDGTKLVTLALVRVSGFASFDANDVNSRTVEFVSVSGWQTPTPTTTTGTF